MEREMEAAAAEATIVLATGDQQPDGNDNGSQVTLKSQRSARKEKTMRAAKPGATTNAMKALPLQPNSRLDHAVAPHADSQLQFFTGYLQLPNEKAAMHYLDSPAFIVAVQLYMKHYKVLQSVKLKQLHSEPAFPRFAQEYPATNQDPFQALIDGAEKIDPVKNKAEYLAYFGWWVTTIPMSSAGQSM